MAQWVLPEEPGRRKPEPRCYRSPDDRPLLVLVNCKCGRGWFCEGQVVLLECPDCNGKSGAVIKR